MKTKEQVEEQFTNSNNKKRQNLLNLTKVFQEILLFMDYKIRKQLKSFTFLSICGGGERNKFMIDTYLESAFENMSLEEKTNLYERTINYAVEYQGSIKDSENQSLEEIENQAKHPKNQTIQTTNNQEKFTKLERQQSPSKKIRFKIEYEKGFRSWQEVYLTLEDFRLNSEDDIKIDLRNYLLRTSKKSDRQCYVLEAFRKSEPSQLRFSFLTDLDKKKFLPPIQEFIEKGYRETITRMAINQNNFRSLNNSLTKSSSSPLRKKPKVLNGPSELQAENQYLQLDSNNRLHQHQVKANSNKSNLKHQLSQGSVIQNIVKCPDDQQFDEELSILIQKQNQQAIDSKEDSSSLSFSSSNAPRKTFQFENLKETTQFKKNNKEKQNQKNYRKDHKNVLKIILPFYNLTEIQNFHTYSPVFSNQAAGIYIFENHTFKNLFKMQLLVKLPAEVALKGLYNVNLYKNWHPQIMQGDLKLSISSQNSAIMSQKHKQFSKWYHERDFLYLRHVFKYETSFYIVDKFIENTNFIPIMGIQRGKIVYQIFKIKPTQESSDSSNTLNSHTTCKITMQISIEHGGLLNASHAKELTLRYLKGFDHFEHYFSKKQFQNKLSSHFNQYWCIDDTLAQDEAFQQKLMKSMTIKSEDFRNQDQILEDADAFFSIDDLSQEDENTTKKQKQRQKSKQVVEIQQISKLKEKEKEKEKVVDSDHELSEAQLITLNKHIPKASMRVSKEEIRLNEEGLAILPKKYLKQKHILNVIERSEKRIDREYDNFVLKDQWRLDPEGLTLINQKIIDAQNGVFKYILSTLKKNIFSGKGNLNISLPVTIFNCDSNLQRLCHTLTLAPHFLEKAATISDHLERIKYCSAFGLSISVLNLQIEKPFNPILGETYQGFINGCPVYAQQISHHPPITSILFYGRGYRIYANLECTVSIHLNSADGINIGWLHIVFDDGQDVCFQSPPGELSGLAVGNRRLIFQKAGYLYDLKNRFFCEMRYQDNSGFFSSKKWKYNDQIDGEIVRVKQTFLQKFLKQFPDKKSSLERQNIQQTYHILSGRWPLNYLIDDELIYNPNEDLPYELIDYAYPLNSNSSYREDLIYRQKEDLSRSQSEKERLEVVQRNDRKLREKFHGKKGH